MGTAFTSRNLLFVGVLLLAAALGGCGKSEEKAPPKAETASPPAAVAASQPAPKAAPVAAAAPKIEPKATPVAPATPQPVPAALKPVPAKPATAQNRGPWLLLGQKTADFKRDSDRLAVGIPKGTFREIQVTVQGAPLEMESIVVTFGNGEQFKPAVRHQFNENSRSRAIDLPGEKRAIQHVDFVYKSTNVIKGKATVQLHGR
jgi:type IV secretory pathway VirB10-like protein